jgi:hypothetical protein
MVEERRSYHLCSYTHTRLRLKCDGTRAKTRFRLSAKRASPFKSAGASVQSTTDSRGVRISGSNAGHIKFGGTHSIRQFPLQFPSCASPCAITFQLGSTTRYIKENKSKDMPLLILSQCGSKFTRGGTYGSGAHGSSGTIQGKLQCQKSSDREQQMV